MAECRPTARHTLLVMMALSACQAGFLQSVNGAKEVTVITSGQEANATTAPGQAASSGQPAAGNTNTNTPSGASASPGSSVPERAGPGVAVYWGTGNFDGKDPNFATVCNMPQYDIIIISFASAIGSKTRNKDGYPEMSISGCGGAIDDRNPYLPDCSMVGALIPTCQAKGKKVILSLGGGGAKVGFTSEAEATAYASTLWNLVLGGKGRVRPFGSAILDGIDLDIEGDTALGYGAFVTALRALMDQDASKKYLITAAPQCVFPDAWMGPNPVNPQVPGPDTALTLALTAFDHLFVQFYNNDCRWANASYFATTYKQWSTLGSRQPKIWIGLPGTKGAATAPDFVAPKDLPALVQAGAALPTYGGVMLWDAGYDVIDAEPGATLYSQSVADAHKALKVSP